MQGATGDGETPPLQKKNSAGPFFHLAGSSEEWAHGIGARYPAGAKIQVAYSPADADLTVLEPGISTEAYWLPGAGAAFFLFGLAALLFIRF